MTAECCESWAELFDVSGSERCPLFARSCRPAGSHHVEYRRAVGHWGLLGKQRWVLDLGCGSGRICAALASLVSSVIGSKSRCAGNVDWRPAEVARRRASPLSQANELHVSFLLARIYSPRPAQDHMQAAVMGNRLMLDHHFAELCTLFLSLTEVAWLSKAPLRSGHRHNG